MIYKTRQRQPTIEQHLIYQNQCQNTDY
jgi:hypothetical protein